MKSQREPWQIAAARYCVENSEGFTLDDLKKYVLSNYSIRDSHFYQFFEEEIQRPGGREFNRAARDLKFWIPPLDLVARVTDYDELKEARESSKKAMYIAVGSLTIAVIVGIAQIIVQIYIR